VLVVCAIVDLSCLSCSLFMCKLPPVFLIVTVLLVEFHLYNVIYLCCDGFVCIICVCSTSIFTCFVQVFIRFM
jgi:hypothetical protein